MKDKLKDKMKKKFTDLSISHKMLMVYITFASAFLLIALGLTQISFRIYSKELYDKSLQELDYFSQNVNRGLKDAERNNYSISMDALVQRTLSDLSVLEYPSLDYNQKIRDLRRILLNEYDPESCVKSIIFVDLYGNTVEVGTAAWDVSGESFTAIKKQMEQGKGAYTTYGPTEECPYLLSGRVVRNRLDMSLSDMGKLIFVCDVGNVISENKESLSSNKAAIYVDCQHFFRQIFLGYFSDIVQAFDTLRKNVCGDDYTSLHNPIVLSSVLPAYGMFHSIQILFL